MLRQAKFPIGLLLVLAAAGLFQHAVADPTTSLMSQLDSGTDPEGCGGFGAACCLRQRNQRCNAPNLACISADGGSILQCVSCGNENEPACARAWGCSVGATLVR